MKNQSSSAASMSKKIGVHQHGQKILVENGKWISTEELKRDAQRGVEYYNSRRPRQYHVI